MEPPDLSSYWLDRGLIASYEALSRDFEWTVPDPFNMASVLVDRWADVEEPAVHAVEPDRRRTASFADLHRRANALANDLDGRGIGRGDAVGSNSAPEAGDPDRPPRRVEARGGLGPDERQLEAAR